MNKKLVWSVAVIAIAAVLAVCAGKSRNTEPRTISVNGECLTTAPKDRTAITLRVTTLDKSAAESMKQATAKIAEITSFLKTQDVKMQTTQFDSYEKTEWDRVAQKSVKLGIETNIAIEVSASNIETIENVLSQFAGQQNVYSENLRIFTSTEAMKPILESCLGTAVENARTRADALAAGDKRRAGKMLAVSYGTSIQDT
ncbi:MAG: SIMPL domain-containing protein, partial [Alphaproteobacteria bacterium]|nr:SIMPL domain-containing protein [Alphaproteobacteria bacterium]